MYVWGGQWGRDGDLPQLLGKPQEARGLWSAGVSGTVAFREKGGPKGVHLPSPRALGVSPASNSPFSGLGGGGGAHLSPSQVYPQHRANTQCLLNESMMAIEVMPVWAFPLRDSLLGTS